MTASGMPGPGAPLPDCLPPFSAPAPRGSATVRVFDTESRLSDSPAAVVEALRAARPHAVVLLFSARTPVEGLARLASHWLPAVEEAAASDPEAVAPVTVVCSQFDEADVDAMRHAVAEAGGGTVLDEEEEEEEEAEARGGAGGRSPASTPSPLSPDAVSAFRAFVSGLIAAPEGASIQTILPAAVGAPGADASSPSAGVRRTAAGVLDAALLPVRLPSAPLLLPGLDDASAPFSRACARLVRTFDADGDGALSADLELPALQREIFGSKVLAAASGAAQAEAAPADAAPSSASAAKGAAAAAAAVSGGAHATVSLLAGTVPDAVTSDPPGVTMHGVQALIFALALNHRADLCYGALAPVMAAATPPHGMPAPEGVLEVPGSVSDARGDARRRERMLEREAELMTRGGRAAAEAREAEDEDEEEEEGRAVAEEAARILGGGDGETAALRAAAAELWPCIGAGQAAGTGAAASALAAAGGATAVRALAAGADAPGTLPGHSAALAAKRGARAAAEASGGRPFVGTPAEASASSRRRLALWAPRLFLRPPSRLPRASALEDRPAPGTGEPGASLLPPLPRCCLTGAARSFLAGVHRAFARRDAAGRALLGPEDLQHAGTACPGGALPFAELCGAETAEAAGGSELGGCAAGDEGVAAVLAFPLCVPCRGGEGRLSEAAWLSSWELLASAAPSRCLVGLLSLGFASQRRPLPPSPSLASSAAILGPSPEAVWASLPALAELRAPDDVDRAAEAMELMPGLRISPRWGLAPLPPRRPSRAEWTRRAAAIRLGVRVPPLAPAGEVASAERVVMGAKHPTRTLFLLGQPASGKTSLVQRWLHGRGGLATLSGPPPPSPANGPVRLAAAPAPVDRDAVRRAASTDAERARAEDELARWPDTLVVVEWPAARTAEALDLAARGACDAVVIAVPVLAPSADEAAATSWAARAMESVPDGVPCRLDAPAAPCPVTLDELAAALSLMPPIPVPSPSAREAADVIRLATQLTLDPWGSNPATAARRRRWSSADWWRRVTAIGVLGGAILVVTAVVLAVRYSGAAEWTRKHARAALDAVVGTAAAEQAAPQAPAPPGEAGAALAASAILPRFDERA